jgi:hypothetical protein
MLLYENSGLDGSDAHAGPARISHDHLYEVLRAVLNQYFEMAPVTCCFDLDSGQGDVLDFVYRISSGRDPGVQGDGFVGVEASVPAVGRSEERYPWLMWARDTALDFLDNREIGHRYKGRVDLIIDKQGRALLETETAAESMLRSAASYLRPGGGYVLAIEAELSSSQLHQLPQLDPGYLRNRSGRLWRQASF